MIKRAIVVLDALGDSEMRFQNQGQVWNRAINDAALAYGYAEVTVRFIPTAREIAQAEIVADWLLWLGNNDGGVHRLVSWAHDEPNWRMAERELCSVRTIHRRIDRSVAGILKEFGGIDAEIQEIEDKPERAQPPNFMTQRSVIADTAPISQHGKVWIQFRAPGSIHRRPTDLRHQRRSGTRERCINGTGIALARSYDRWGVRGAAYLIPLRHFDLQTVLWFNLELALLLSLGGQLLQGVALRVLNVALVVALTS
ncbi:hypothetical protein SAMN05216374_0468 [Tardiphaga sp. OK246]|uniref:DUF6362 family protein n=1 Tax=Tardiphaga sp. OK246 TaxID=1855307 RepID=UPI000B64190E|nr:DUF6362 family protein [Tardiphaga sp. OK246]SNS24399.1 hypothetical protein SAMN05216374_0468 [Tardiphaga sp. OK246]